MAGMEMLTKKYGPLPGYAWLAIGVGGVYLYMRHAQGTGTSGSPTDTTGDTGTSPAQEYGSGFDSGFGSGYEAGTNSGSTTGTTKQTAPKGSQYCRSLKAPNGHTYRVCGLGHWVSTGKHSVKWVHGLAPKHSKYPKSYPVPTTRKTVRVP
jgi:hypothetical protein